jgi:hypothetical protein
VRGERRTWCLLEAIELGTAAPQGATVELSKVDLRPQVLAFEPLGKQFQPICHRLVQSTTHAAPTLAVAVRFETPR